MIVRKDVTEVAAFQLDFRHTSEHDNNTYYIAVVGSEISGYQGGGNAKDFIEEEWVVLRACDMNRPIGHVETARQVLDSFFSHHWNCDSKSLRNDGHCHFRRFVKKQKQKGCPLFGGTINVY